jgi:phosphoribosylglycinamide formyltransferase-1
LNGFINLVNLIAYLIDKMEKKRLAVFASGRGSNFKAIIDKTNSGYIPADVSLLITNNPEAGAIDIARKYSIPWRAIVPKDFPDREAYNEKILSELIDTRIDFIVLAGYLKLVGKHIVDRYSNKIINIHPALLPSFGGKGMYGHHVHQAVYDRGVKVSGVTVHLVNNEYDAGPIVLQRCVSIDSAKSPEEIASRVLTIEHEIFPKAIKLMVEENLMVNGSRVQILGEN